MFRGTTPTFNFTLPFDGRQITALNVCFAQQQQVVLEKTLADCAVEENALRVTLTEEETLRFDADKGNVEIQLRVGCGDARMASNIMVATVERILKDGCLA